MIKKKIAVLAGGYSGERVISHRSVATVMNHLDRNLYDLYKLIIEKNRWYHELEDGSTVDVDKNDFSILIGGQKINFDGVFIVIHGTPGEDGKLQGYFEMLDIPFSTCSGVVSGLTFNKTYCNLVVKGLGVANVAKSVRLFKNRQYSIQNILDTMPLPLFVKPNESGSSLGVSKVVKSEELSIAIEKAFQEDDEILIEVFIEGRELTMGAYRMGDEIITLPPTEIISKNTFFDFEAKYTTGITDEITPANIPGELLERMKKNTADIYLALSCRGVVRIDYIWDKTDDKLYFLEINTMPGQSENSLIPQQVRAAGLELSDFYSSLIQEMLNPNKVIVDK